MSDALATTSRSRCSISARSSPVSAARWRRWRARSPAPARIPGFSSSPITASRPRWSRMPSRKPHASSPATRPASSPTKSANIISAICRLAGRWCGIRLSTTTPSPISAKSFYITRDRAPDHPDIVNNKKLIGLNRWPDDMPEFRAAMVAYYSAMEVMTRRMVPAVAAALDLPDNYFADAFAEPHCTLRLIHHPPHPAPEDNEFGFAPHTDNNFITFLAQSKLPGLEVRTAEGEWIRPPAVPETFVVNTGATLARYSNDRIKATPHRVINRNDQARYAIPFFLGPNHDALVECVPSCVGPDNPPRYEPTTYGAFSSRLLTFNFAHRRGEMHQ